MNNILFKILMLKGDAGNPTDEQTVAAVGTYIQEHPEVTIDETIITSAVDDWLDDHPEATTSVLDGSLTELKFADSLKIKNAVCYDTTDDMIADTNLINGMKCACLGRNQAGDCKHLLHYKITDEATANNMDILPLSNGLFAELVVDKFLDIKALGIQNNDDLRPYLIKAQDISDHVYVTGTYTMHALVNITKNISGNFTVNITNSEWGNGSGKSAVVFNIYNVSDISFSGLNLVGDTDQRSGNIQDATIAFHGVRIIDSNNIIVSNITGTKLSRGISVIGSCKNISVQDCNITTTLMCYAQEDTTYPYNQINLVSNIVFERCRGDGTIVFDVGGCGNNIVVRDSVAEVTYSPRTNPAGAPSFMGAGAFLHVNDNNAPVFVLYENCTFFNDIQGGVGVYVISEILDPDLGIPTLGEVSAVFNKCQFYKNGNQIYNWHVYANDVHNLYFNDCYFEDGYIYGLNGQRFNGDINRTDSKMFLNNCRFERTSHDLQFYTNTCDIYLNNSIVNIPTGTTAGVFVAPADGTCNFHISNSVINASYVFTRLTSNIKAFLCNCIGSFSKYAILTIPAQSLAVVKTEYVTD